MIISKHLNAISPISTPDNASRFELELVLRRRSLGFVRIFAPALTRTNPAGFTAVGAGPPERVPRPHRISQLAATTANMSGPVATARPPQALRLRRESQRPGVARTVTRPANMETEAARQDTRRYGMRPLLAAGRDYHISNS
jgi:hypothetical protein